jgi:putative membrane protein
MPDGWRAEMFLWLKAAHVISVFAWMAGLFYLPRLFVYHSMAPVAEAVSEQLKIMERRLARAIMLPAAVASWLFGILTAISGGYFFNFEMWFGLKLLLVVGLTGFHVILQGYVAVFAVDGRPRDHRYFRVLNEVPTAVLIAIVILAIVKPF